MKKILDFLIIFLLVFLFINLFTNQKQKEINSNLKFSVSSSSYSIPANVILKIDNWTNKPINLNTCENININFSWENLVFSDTFCKDLSLKPKEKFNLDYSSEYEKFTNLGNYVFEINLSWKKYIQSFQIKHKWAIPKIFVTLFYAPIYNLMIFLINLFSYSMWWAIISITIIIRIILLYPQYKMMLSQKNSKLFSLKSKKYRKNINENHKYFEWNLWSFIKRKKLTLFEVAASCLYKCQYL